MRPKSDTNHGFTLIEMAVVVAVIAILAALAGSALMYQRPRANLANASVELHALMQTARQTALATGHDVAVLVFQDYPNRNETNGRFILYEDAFFDFFTGGATGGVNFANYNPNVLAYGTGLGTQSAVLDTMDLPFGVVIGPPTGMGSTATLPAPLSGVVVNVACSFCDSSGSNRRGAVKFDPRGQVTFYNSTTSGSASTPLTVTSGSSLSLEAPEVTGQRTLIITSPAGAIRTIAGG